MCSKCRLHSRKACMETFNNGEGLGALQQSTRLQHGGSTCIAQAHRRRARFVLGLGLRSGIRYVGRGHACCIACARICSVQKGTASPGAHSSPASCTRTRHAPPTSE